MRVQQQSIRFFAFTFSLTLASSTAMAIDDGQVAVGSDVAPRRVAQNAKSAAPIVIYVEDFTVDPKVEQDGGGLAATFCNDLGKDKTLDVVCAPDVQQLMNYEAFRGLAGNAQAGGAPALKKRLGLVTVVVIGEVKQGKHGLISILSVHDRDTSMGDEIVAPGGMRGKVHVKGIANGVSGLHAKYPEFARRVGEIAKRGPSGRPYGEPLPNAQIIDDQVPKARVIEDKATVAE
jgi:hypothetical protein